MSARDAGASGHAAGYGAAGPATPAVPAAPATLPPRAAGRSRELLYALTAVVAVTALYAVAATQEGRLPAASGLVGHGIGIAGSVLMLLTATLYPLRKLRTDARWGASAAWLRFHMVTGLVGPYMVLLHSSLRFSGLAGVTLLLTALVVASGVTGRYLYARVPRAPSTEAAARRRRTLAAWHLVHLPLTWALLAAATVHVIAALYYATLGP